VRTDCGPRLSILRDATLRSSAAVMESSGNSSEHRAQRCAIDRRSCAHSANGSRRASEGTPPGRPGSTLDRGPRRHARSSANRRTQQTRSSPGQVLGQSSSSVSFQNFIFRSTRARARSGSFPLPPRTSRSIRGSSGRDNRRSIFNVCDWGLCDVIRCCVELRTLEFTAQR
jgi:hypothetical protein